MTTPETDKSSSNTTYRDAGVDIDAGNRLVERIKPLAAATRRPGADGSLGGFGGLFDAKAAGYADPVLIAATDGVGTKLKLAIDANIHDTVGIDLVAMCVNDLVVQGAEPLIFLDYFACGKLDVDAAEAVVAGIAKGCETAGCALIGGETAEMPGMYADGHYDLAGFSVGAAERGRLIDGSKVAEGDILLGLASNGVHSNGFSLVRRVLEKSGLALDEQAPWTPDESVGRSLLSPTRIYVKSCLQAIAAGGVHALCHVTGGGFYENLPRITKNDVGFEVDRTAWPAPPVFDWLAEAGNIDAHEMHRTFNCGIGMILAVAPEYVETIEVTLRLFGESVHRIGRVSGAKTQQPVHIAGID